MSQGRAAAAGTLDKSVLTCTSHTRNPKQREVSPCSLEGGFESPCISLWLPWQLSWRVLALCHVTQTLSWQAMRVTRLSHLPFGTPSQPFQGYVSTGTRQIRDGQFQNSSWLPHMGTGWLSSWKDTHTYFCLHGIKRDSVTRAPS